uniref:RING-type domain-containing protein n=1 Tax=Haemonchus placei TaxID=6290 RepID=A0A0N4WUA0_HAEPC
LIQTAQQRRQTACVPLLCRCSSFKWNALATWAWDVDCDTCAICRVQLMEECLRCQADASSTDCVVVWGDCNHAFHNCCMSQWVRQNNRCPLCQQDWVVQRVGR